MFSVKPKKKKSSAVRKNVLPKKTFPKRIMVAAVFVVAIVAAGIVLKQTIESSRVFPVKQVRIEGEFIYLDERSVKKQISQVSVGGFFDLDIAGIRNELMKLQWIDDAFVRREWPDSVVIRVVEKQPVASWNKRGILTASSQLFYPHEIPQIDELVALEGPGGRHKFVLTELNKIQSLLHQAEIKVSSLSQNARRSWKMEIDQVEVQLGRKDIYKKIESFGAIYQSLLKPKLNQIKQIDFRYTNGFAVLWREKAARNMNHVDAITMNRFQNNMNERFLIGAVRNV